MPRLSSAAEATLIRRQTKLPIPHNLLKKHTLQFDDELAKKVVQVPSPPSEKALQGPTSTSEKSSETIRNTSSKRPRSADEDAALATPKRVKAEVSLSSSYDVLV